MNDNEVQQILSAILEQAEGEPSIYRPINSWVDFVEHHRLYKSTKLIIGILKDSSKSLFNTYCKDVIAGISDVTKLIAYNQLDDIIAFYQNELLTITKMLDDYEEYLWQGNFFYAFMGGERF